MEEIIKDKEKYAKLEALANSEGGKLLLDTLKSDLKGSINTLIGNYRSTSHIEIICLIAQLESRLELYKRISNSSKNKALTIEELEHIVKDE